MTKRDAAGTEIALIFGGPSWARNYRPHALSRQDASRACVARAPRAERDWRVSRALAARLREQAGIDPHAPVSLSHSRGHALVAHGPAQLDLGVDLEFCAPRDVWRLADWVCTPAERDLLARTAGADAAALLEAFYGLWTLKEALVKAGRLDFPADMAAVGLAPDAGPGDAAGLRAPRGAWRAVSYGLPGGWVAAVAWGCAAAGSGPAAAARLRWLDAAPDCRLLGAWRTG